jgi:predicted extracellular nuclease
VTTTRRVLAAAAALVGAAIAVPTAPTDAATGDPVLLNEVLASTVGADAEFFELFGTPGAALDDLTVIVVESDADSASLGRIDAQFDFPAGASIGGNGYYLVGTTLAADSFGVVPNATLPANFFENSSTTIALMETAALAGKGVGDFVAGVETVVDGFVNSDNATDTGFFGLPVLGPDGTFLPAGWSRTVEGVDTDTAADWTMLDFFLSSPPPTPTAGADGSPGPDVLVNATLVSTTGTDAEYVELYGAPGTSLDGLAVVGIESDAISSNGRIDHYYPLPAGSVVGDNGFYLMANATAAAAFGIIPNATLPGNALENSSITIALVEISALGGKAGGDTLDGTEVALDAVALTDGDAGDTFWFDAPIVGPDGDFLPAGAARVADGVDTDLVADWDILAFSPITAPENVPTVGTGSTGGEPVAAKIHQVQGSGAESPLVDRLVVVEGVVVGDEEGPDPALGGFFVQEEDADVDADPATSEGVFVDSSGADEVNVGDAVRVTGIVGESFGNTQLAAVEVEVLSSGSPLPSAAAITFPVDAVDDLEAHEGMLATLSDTLVISEYFNYDRFGEIVVAKPAESLGTSRAMNPTAVYAPEDPAAAALRDLNLRSRITVDDGNTDQNPDVNIHPINREPFSLDNSFRGGDTVTGLSGPIYYSFGLYRILPLGDLDGDGVNDGFSDYTRNPAPTAPEPVGGELTVATLNALNYFATVDPDPNPTFGTAEYDVCGPNLDLDCRGADDDEERVRQHVKLMNALVGMDADVVGLVELENTAGVEALASIVDGDPDFSTPLDGLNDLLGDGTYDYVAAGDDGVVGTDAIKVGIIYRPAAVTPFGAPAVLDSPEFLDPLGSGRDRNRAAVAQSFVENATGEVFSVVVNHFKSKGSSCGEPDEGGLTGSCNLTRTAAAGVLADWLASDPTGSGDADWLILGDLNSYDQEDPIVALETAGYTDLIGSFQGEYAYSYVFDGEVGYLDYAMSSPSMTGQVTGATEWHINADEPDIVDYDTGFKSDAQDAFFDPTTPFRASDHDAALVGVALDSGFDATVVAEPARLWPPNHELRAIDLFTTSPALMVTPSSAISSEADSGLGEDDVPNDIVVDDGIELRAERYALDGRTYTITALVTDGSQVVVVDDINVVVPHDQRDKQR